MASYAVTNTATGINLGTYDAANAEGALAAMAEEAGFPPSASGEADPVFCGAFRAVEVTWVTVTYAGQGRFISCASLVDAAAVLHVEFPSAEFATWGDRILVWENEEARQGGDPSRAVAVIDPGDL